MESSRLDQPTDSGAKEANAASSKGVVSCLSQITSDVLQHALYGKRAITNEDEVLLLPNLTNIPSEVHVASSRIPGQNIGIFSTTWMCEGTKMGPITGQIKETINSTNDNCWAWEVFDLSDDGKLVHVVDGSNEETRCWLHYINCARNEQEQNLEIVQNEKEIFFRVLKSIPPNQELLVWYGTAQRLYLGVPGIGVVPVTDVKPRIVDAVTATNSSTPHPNLHCVLCQHGFNSRSNLRSHMRTHTLERPFVCRFCHRRFSQSSTLRNHVRLHTGEKPYKCLVCQSAYSQLAGLRAHQKSARHRPTSTATEVSTT